jgi:hypothetical protein
MLPIRFPILRKPSRFSNTVSRPAEEKILRHRQCICRIGVEDSHVLEIRLTVYVKGSSR